MGPGNLYVIIKVTFLSDCYPLGSLKNQRRNQCRHENMYLDRFNTVNEASQLVNGEAESRTWIFEDRGPRLVSLHHFVCLCFI